ncbi:hypothetical protein DW322_13585 [Rhodococcus rhodnii]|uniref:ABC Fe(3+) transporter n=2 Tax=Rhodococcus rhodnii TaxID=38312 RepID=R7WKU4_9NOCA|nr:ABC transporter substrate-binding protein [Rhodococcus rhodnii]EOM75900.1 ABC Fe(3+) transporter [Rhodococcus rhodnii LMG 5362]TXG91064.1 hypothetical protein DW322_13585 [Rhodococcus rhodnii]
MNRPARIVAALIASAVLLTACGGGGTDSEDDAAGEAAATRMLDTPAGPVEIPVDPQRIVTTHNIGTQPLLDLGITPIGVASVPESIVVPEYLDRLRDVPVVTDGETVAVEQIATLEPDLILSHSGTDPNVLDSLRAIAPVVLVPIEGELRSDWRRRIDVVADAVGRTDRKNELDTELDARAAEIADEHQATLSEATVSFLDSYDPADFWAYGPESMVGEILTEAGARFAPSTEGMTPTRGPGERNMSREDLATYADGSMLLYSSTMTDPAEIEPYGQVASLVETPMVTGSDAGRVGHVYPGGYALVSNYGQALFILDRFDDALTAYAEP